MQFRIIYNLLPPACPRGYFGKDCAQKCNDTCIGCNTSNGLCESGCSPGWKGDYCHKGCSVFPYYLQL